MLLDTEHTPLPSRSLLSPRWMGPFRALERTAPNMYRLDIPATWRAFPEFNVERLRPYLRGSDDLTASATTQMSAHHRQRPARTRSRLLTVIADPGPPGSRRPAGCQSQCTSVSRSAAAPRPWCRSAAAAAPSAKCPLQILAKKHDFCTCKSLRKSICESLRLLAKACKTMNCESLRKVAKACETLQTHICEFARKLANACEIILANACET